MCSGTWRARGNLPEGPQVGAIESHAPRCHENPEGQHGKTRSDEANPDTLDDSSSHERPGPAGRPGHRQRAAESWLRGLRGERTRNPREFRPGPAVIQRDTEVVYRVGVSLADQEAVEQGLRAELTASGEIPVPVVATRTQSRRVVSYTGVVRQDLTIDPEDPRYQSFSVGYGRSWDEAERSATTLNDRFATNYDGDGYELLVRETWGVARSPANLADEEICSGVYSRRVLDGNRQPPRMLPVESLSRGQRDGRLERSMFQKASSTGAEKSPGTRTGEVSQRVSGLNRRGDPRVSPSSETLMEAVRKASLWTTHPTGVWTYFDQDGQEMFTIGYLVPGERPPAAALSGSDAVRDNGAHFDTWTVTAIAGQRLVITMERRSWMPTCCWRVKTGRSLPRTTMAASGQMHDRYAGARGRAVSCDRQ